MQKYTEPKKAIDQLIEKVGKKIVLATPLGAGKPNHLLNALYHRAKNDPSIELTILTALTLQVPEGKSALEKKFMGPFLKRVFQDYPNLDYEEDRLHNRLPKNVDVIEFYFKAGQFKDHHYAQRHYLSSNYTHVVRDTLNRGVNVICQQICAGEYKGEEVYSLSCNPDTAKDAVDLLKKEGRDFVSIAQVNQDLPFMFGESIVPTNYFDIVVDNRDLDYAVFAPPKMSVSDADYMIGIHASTLIKDDGEIQIGIGSLGDALVYSLGLREKDNAKYREVLNELEINEKSFPVIKDHGSFETFDKGLFAATEMLVDSFMLLYQKGILKKKVYDSLILQRLLNQGLIKEDFGVEIFEELYRHHAIMADLTANDVSFLKEFGIIKEEVIWKGNKLHLNGEELSNNIFEVDLQKIIGDRLRNGAIAHGGFFLGPRSFYNFLKELPENDRKLFRMKRISQINHLYGHEEIDRLQRINGRFVNTCMKVTLNGSASSDALEDGNQISGVGGQYNFVAMAQELPDARSVLQLRSCRVNKQGKLESNIVFNYGNCTIPRHLRDIVITEYGIADLRSKTDEEVAVELIQITDSRLQDELIQKAIDAKKLPKDFKLKDRFRSNYPERYTKVLAKYKKQDLFEPFPLRHDFTDEELVIGKALKKLKSLQLDKIAFAKFAAKALVTSHDLKKNEVYLKRMDLLLPRNTEEKLYQKLLLAALA